MNEFSELRRQGLSIQAISAMTGFDRKTVRKYLLKPEEIPAYGPRPPLPSKLDRFKPYLEERLQAGVWNAVVLLRELRARDYRQLHDPEGLAATAAGVGTGGGGTEV